MPGSNNRRHESMSGANPNTMENMGYLTVMKNFLRYEVSPGQHKIWIKANRFGKMLKGLEQFSPETLTGSELVKARNALSAILRLWPKNGLPEWKCQEADGIYFTLVFTRKE